METTGTEGTIVKAIKYGVLGGLVGMLAMDIVMMPMFLIGDLPAYIYLSLIGSVVGRGVLVGVVIHILISAVLGIAFASMVLKFEGLRITSIRKGFILGLWIGIISIAGCVPFAIITGIPLIVILSFSTLPQLIWGAACGMVLGYKLQA